MGRGAGVSESKNKKMDRRTGPNQFAPSTFIEVGDITVHTVNVQVMSRTGSYHLTLKCDLDLQPT